MKLVAVLFLLLPATALAAPCPRGDAAAEEGVIDRAIAAYTACIQAGLDQADKKAVFYARGDQYMRDGQFLEARMDYGVSLAIDPEDSAGYFRLARLFALEGRHKEAVDQANQAIYLDPENIDAFRRRALSRIAMGTPWPAYDDLNLVLERRPADWEARLARAEVLRAIGRPVDALADVEAVLDAEPDNQTALFQHDILLGILEE